MFGQFCYQRDAALHLAPEVEREQRQAEYAMELLEALLNRARELEDLGSAWRDLHSGPDADHYLRSFAHAALDFFEQECEESRIRGRRARLFADVGDGRIDASCVERDADLAAIGGALVPDA